MINFAIVDDNEIVRNQISMLIDKTVFLKRFEFNIYQYESAELFLEDSKIINHHILICEVVLPGISGIDLARIISKRNKQIIIIFLTSYEQYMKNAFGICVYCYLMKSESEKMLPSVLNEVIEVLSNKERRIFKIPNGLLSLFLDEILYIELRNRNPHIVLNNLRTYKLSPQSLKSIYKLINSNDFVRINNHVIVNMNYIVSLVKNEIRLAVVNKSFRLSRAKHERILDAYQRYLARGIHCE